MITCSRSRRAFSSRRRPRELLVLARPLGFRRRELDPRLRDRAVHGVEHGGQRFEHAGGRIDLPATDDGAARGLLGSGALGVELTGERLSPGLLGPDALLGGLDGEPGLDLGLAGGLELGGERVASADVEDRTRAGTGRLQLGTCLVGGGLRFGHALGGERERRRQPVELGLRRLQLHLQPVELLGLRCELGVELTQRGERRLRLLLRHLQHAALLGERELRPVDERGDLAQPILRRRPGRR